MDQLIFYKFEIRCTFNKIDETYGKLTPAGARKIIRKIRREENKKATKEGTAA